MPEIKIKHVVSFSSEDKVHKAENILKSETYRKWKCASAGEKNASIVLQFEKATQIHSIDIGNESSAFVEVLVGRSSDSVSDYQVLLVASSFMSPLESRNENHTNRVRMFGPDKLAQNLKDEKWDCIQVVCTQPFNKNISYGLTFIKFHSPPEKPEEHPGHSVVKAAPVKLGAFRLKYEDEEEDSSPTLFPERKNKNLNSLSSATRDSPSYAATVLASSSSVPLSPQNNSVKRKSELQNDSNPPAKRESLISHVNKEKIGYKDILGPKEDAGSSSKQSREDNSVKDKKVEKPKVPNQKPSLNVSLTKEQSSNKIDPKKKKKPFGRIMEGVVFVLSGFVNPLRGEIRDKALEMGAKYRGDWDRSCTHLICAFVNTPKFTQVQGKGGKIVKKDWIMDCHKGKTLLPWRRYMLGTSGSDSDSDSSEDSDSEFEEIASPPKRKGKNPKLNGASKKNENGLNAKVPSRRLSSSEEESLLQPSVPKKSPVKSRVAKSDESETEDEDALQDYLADTDVDSDSGGNTEDEILKVEMQTKAKKSKNLDDDDSDESLLPSKPDTSDLPLPELPSLFKKRHFFLYGDFSPKTHHDLLRCISAYDGVVEDYMSVDVKYVITESKWDKNFEEALSENEDIIFVKPEWIFKCQEAGKLLPYQPYIVIPDS